MTQHTQARQTAGAGAASSVDGRGGNGRQGNEDVVDAEFEVEK